MKYLSFCISTLFLASVITGVAHSAPKITEVSKVLTGRCLADYQSKYKSIPKRKAFAVASDENGRQTCAWRNNNMFSGPANFDALNACDKLRAKRKIKNECVVLDSDAKIVVEEGVLPELQDTGYDIPVGQDYVTWHDEAMAVVEGRLCQRRFRRYMQYGGFKTFAYTVSEGGFYSVCAYDTRPAPDLSEKLALDRCNKRRLENVYSKTSTPECKILAKNNEILLSRADFGMPDFKPDSLTSARRLHLDTIKTFVKGGEDINQTDKRGRTALFYSVETNRPEVIRYLISKGADVNLAANNGKTPLQEANRRKYKDIAAYLIRKGAVEQVTPEPEPAAVAVLDADIPLAVPTMALDSKLTNDHVDQFLNIMPSTSKALDSLQKKLASNKAANKRLMSAMTKGELFRTVVTVAGEYEEITGLEVEVKNAGYQSIADWAYIGDRIVSVFMVGEMMSAIASIPYAEMGFVEGTNVFEFIADDSKPIDIRNKLQTELESDCAKSCVVPADLAVAGARIEDIAEAFKGL